MQPAARRTRRAQRRVTGRRDAKRGRTARAAGQLPLLATAFTRTAATRRKRPTSPGSSDAFFEREEGRSIGIIAFSEAQQARSNRRSPAWPTRTPEFARRLELEWEREDDGQFVGLLVKNLENIQGDERDVIIISVCYGPARDGKMLMNFGPINQTGGERRLNVAFSRARSHMALVELDPLADITNDYNEGAHCLKNYLRYAEAASIGDVEIASQILRSLSQPRTATDILEQADDAVVGQLAEVLRQRGYRVDRAVGQSRLRCDLGVSRSEDRSYRLGILVDTAEWYAQHDLDRTRVAQARLARRVRVADSCRPARDWYDDPAGVLERIDRLLAGQELEEPGDDDELLPPDPARAPGTKAVGSRRR